MEDKYFFLDVQSATSRHFQSTFREKYNSQDCDIFGQNMNSQHGWSDEKQKVQESFCKPMLPILNKQQHQPCIPPLRTFTLSRDHTIAGRSQFPSDTYGLRLVHGEIPGSLGCYGCVISHIFKGSLSGGSSDDIHEGDEVVEINGIPMASKSDKQIQLIVGTIREDMELTTRSYSTRNHYDDNPIDRQSLVEFGPVNQWYFDEEFWPGPRTGEVSAKKAFEDDMSLIKSLGYRKTKCNTQHHVNSTTSNTKSKTLNTPWGKIVKPTKSEFLGMVEIQMSFDYNANILYVTIIQAKNLKSFSGNIAKPDAFILGYILPHRTMATMRKTSYIMESSSPFWNQTFVYPGESLLQLKTKQLEITAWSHNRNLANEFLGEFMLDLSDPKLLDEKGHWYQLKEGEASKSVMSNGPNVATNRLSYMHR